MCLPYKAINNLPQGNLNVHWLHESSLADDILIKLYRQLTILLYNIYNINLNWITGNL